MRLKFGISLFISSSPFYGKEFHKSKHEMGKIDATIQSRAPCPNYLVYLLSPHLAPKEPFWQTERWELDQVGRRLARAGEGESGGMVKQWGGRRSEASGQIDFNLSARHSMPTSASRGGIIKQGKDNSNKSASKLLREAVIKGTSMNNPASQPASQTSGSLCKCSASRFCTTRFCNSCRIHLAIPDPAKFMSVVSHVTNRKRPAHYTYKGRQ